MKKSSRHVYSKYVQSQVQPSALLLLLLLLLLSSMNRCKTAETLFQVVAVTVPNLITYLLTYCHEA